MQKVVYKCDHCGKETEGKNISLRFSTHSGVALPPEGLRAFWLIHSKLDQRFMHFCNPECLYKYFKRLFKEAK